MTQSESTVIDSHLSSRIDQVLDRWFAAYKRTNSFFELAICLRHTCVLPEVFRP